MLRNVVNIFLIAVVLIFSFGHLFDSKFLTTYKYDSFFQNDDLSTDHTYVLVIDIDGVVKRQKNKINKIFFIKKMYQFEI